MYYVERRYEDFAFVGTWGIKIMDENLEIIEKEVSKVLNHDVTAALTRTIHYWQTHHEKFLIALPVFNKFYFSTTKSLVTIS